MRHLAAAVIDAAAFLELSDGQALDPDHAVKALEQMAAVLAEAGPEEVAALQEVLDRRVAEACTESGRVFYREFLESFGLVRDPAP